MNAFVTGGSGFLGRNLIPALVQSGFSVQALARSDAAARAVVLSGARAVRGDLDDPASLSAGIAGCEVVFHAAARVEQWGTKEQFMRANVGGTERVLEAARAAGVSRVVHVSTEAVLLGGPPIVRANETWPYPAHPVGLYALTKGLAEARVIAENGRGLETVVVRPRLIWGRGDTSILPDLIDACRKGRFRWIGGGRHLTSTCHIQNVCEGMILAAQRGRPGEIYFLTDGAPVEFRTFVARMLASAGADPGSGTLPFGVALSVATLCEGVWRLFRLRGMPPVTRMAVGLAGQEVTVDDTKARRDLGYLGRMTLEQGLSEMEAAGRSTHQIG